MFTRAFYTFGKKLLSLCDHTVPHDVAVGTQGSILAMLPTHSQRVPLELCQVRDKDSSSWNSWRTTWLHGLTVQSTHTMSVSVAVPLAGSTRLESTISETFVNVSFPERSLAKHYIRDITRMSWDRNQRIMV